MHPLVFSQRRLEHYCTFKSLRWSGIVNIWPVIGNWKMFREGTGSVEIGPTICSSPIYFLDFPVLNVSSLVLLRPPSIYIDIFLYIYLYLYLPIDRNIDMQPEVAFFEWFPLCYLFSSTFWHFIWLWHLFWHLIGPSSAWQFFILQVTKFEVCFGREGEGK